MGRGLWGGSEDNFLKKCYRIINITFSMKNFDLHKFENYASISPQLKNFPQPSLFPFSRFVSKLLFVFRPKVWFTFFKETFHFQIESLIPLKDDRDIKSELEKKRGDSYRAALDEHNELVQQLTAKNRHLKEIIDSMRGIIWEVNTMLCSK